MSLEQKYQNAKEELFNHIKKVREDIIQYQKIINLIEQNRKSINKNSDNIYKNTEEINRLKKKIVPKMNY